RHKSRPVGPSCPAPSPALPYTSASDTISGVMSLDTFKTRRALTVGGDTAQYYSLPALEAAGHPGIAKLPYSLRILLENLLRREDGRWVRSEDIEALAGRDVTAGGQREIAFMPARVL